MQTAENPIKATTSGESPVLLAPTAPPGGPSPAAAFCPPIRVARDRDLKFLSNLQKLYSNHLGYLPTAALQWYVTENRIGIVLQNGDPAGYVLGRTHYRYQPLMRPITQAAVAMDAQRRHLGLALIARTCAHATAAGQVAVQACCAADLDANEFWYAAGFAAIGTLAPSNARGRTIVVWRKRLTTEIPAWFFDAPPVAGHRAKRTN